MLFLALRWTVVNHSQAIVRRTRGRRGKEELRMTLAIIGWTRWWRTDFEWCGRARELVFIPFWMANSLVIRIYNFQYFIQKYFIYFWPNILLFLNDLFKKWYRSLLILYFHFHFYFMFLLILYIRNEWDIKLILATNLATQKFFGYFLATLWDFVATRWEDRVGNTWKFLSSKQVSKPA